MSRFGAWLLGIVLLGGVFGGYLLHADKQQRDQEEEAYRLKERERFAALTPEQQAKELALKEKIKNEMAAKAAAEAKQTAAEADAKAVAVAGAKSLMAAMKSPDSFQISDVTYVESGSICYTYRARNSFNAVIQSNAVIDSQAKDPKILTSDRDGNRFVSVWNKKCASKSGKDWTDLVQLSIGRV